MKKFLSILSLIVVLSACVGRNSEQEPPIRYLSRSLTDTTFVGYHCLADYSPEDLHSAVAVIGDFDCCRELTSVFIAADFSTISTVVQTRMSCTILQAKSSLRCSTWPMLHIKVSS